jgi:hypothetical protein
MDVELTFEFEDFLGDWKNDKVKLTVVVDERYAEYVHTGLTARDADGLAGMDFLYRNEMD